jgi:hypothetical protein
MSALEVGLQGGNLGVVALSTSSAVVRRVDGWRACLIPIPPAMGSHVSHFEVNLAHPMQPTTYDLSK